jgi:hypothetical protein
VIALGVAMAATVVAAGCAHPAVQHPSGVAKRTVTSAADRARHLSAKHKPTSQHRLPKFSAKVSGPLTRRDVRFSWRPGCPVPPRRLREIRMTYAGFDRREHVGRLIVNASVVRQVIEVFGKLYRAKFPIKMMKPVDAFHGSDPRSMAADNTSGFNCRKAVSSGPPSWSMHAFGLAIDVNTVQNPYVQPGRPVEPKAGAAYVNRSDVRRGMAYPGGVLVSAFRSVGWGWGGDWAGAPDYQHFSTNGT